MKYIILGVLAVVLLSSGVYVLTTFVDNSPTADKAESSVAITASGKMGVRISDTLCTTYTGTVEICVN